MRVILGLSLLFSLACAFGPTAAPPPPPADDFGVTDNRIARGISKRAPPDLFADAVAGRYIVKLKDRAGAGARVGANGMLSTGERGVDEALGRARMKRVRPVHRRGAGGGLYAVDADGDAASLQALGQQEGVEWVEPVRRYGLAGTVDPYYKYQWNMGELDLTSVHARTQGQGVVVAVLDYGVTPGTDRPANVLTGWDFMDDDNDARDTAAPTQSPEGSHGTHVAGTIAQISDNGVGVAGIAPMVSILPVRVGDYNGVTSENIAEGIQWAVDHGAHVINISIGGASSSRVIEEACRYAYDHGVVVVAASGNDGYSGKVSYPAAYPTVIAVGAHDAAYKETSYSNNGRQLALLAPGGDTTADLNHDGKPDGILQGTITSQGWGYAMMQGTSMASPHVAGAAALLISAGVRGPDAVRSALVGGATSVGGFPILNILGALDYKGPVAGTVPAAPVTPAGPTPGTRRGPAGVGSGRGERSAAVRPVGPGGKRPGGGKGTRTAP